MSDLPDEVFIIWLAGFFDGEGHIRKKEFQITVSQTVSEAAEKIFRTCISHFGGKLSLKRAKKPEHNDILIWTLMNRDDCENFLEVILPYLRLKRADANKMLERIRMSRLGKSPWFENDLVRLIELWPEYSLSKIAKILRRGSKNVRKKAKELGLPPKKAPGYSDVFRREILRRWRESGMTKTDFAKIAGINRCTLSKWAKRFGYPMRRPATQKDLELARRVIKLHLAGKGSLRSLAHSLGVRYSIVRRCWKDHKTS